MDAVSNFVSGPRPKRDTELGIMTAAEFMERIDSGESILFSDLSQLLNIPIDVLLGG